MKDTKRTVRGERTMAKGSISGKIHLHPHTVKALNAASPKTGIKHGSSAGTSNGLACADMRY